LAQEPFGSGSSHLHLIALASRYPDPMQLCAVVLLNLLVVSFGFTACKRQDVFDIMMCKSHMCTGCVLAWCTEQCQKIQSDFPDCRCEHWAAGRASYSDGDFQGKGKYGDVGDYSKDAAATATVPPETVPPSTVPPTTVLPSTVPASTTTTTTTTAGWTVPGPGSYHLEITGCVDEVYLWDGAKFNFIADNLDPGMQCYDWEGQPYTWCEGCYYKFQNAADMKPFFEKKLDDHGSVFMIRGGPGGEHPNFLWNSEGEVYTPNEAKIGRWYLHAA